MMPGQSRGTRRRRQAQAKARRKAAKAKVCGCGKRIYPNEMAAVAAQATLGLGRRVYQCHDGVWHITSKKRW